MDEFLDFPSNIHPFLDFEMLQGDDHNHLFSTAIRDDIPSELLPESSHLTQNAFIHSLHPVKSAPPLSPAPALSFSPSAPTPVQHPFPSPTSSSSSHSHLGSPSNPNVGPNASRASSQLTHLVPDDLFDNAPPLASIGSASPISNSVFLDNLEPSLRAEVLRTCDEQFLKSLRPDHLAEAQRVRATSTQKTLQDDNIEQPADSPEGIYEVEQILDVDDSGSVPVYLVRWKGYGSADDTWEPATNLNCNLMIRRFRESRRPEQTTAESTTQKKTARNTARGKRQRGKSAKSRDEPAVKKQEKIPKTRRYSRGATKKTAQVVTATTGGESNDGSEEEYEIEAILGHKHVAGKKHYFVKWKGYSSSDNTWEPQENIEETAQFQAYLKSIQQSPVHPISASTKKPSPFVQRALFSHEITFPRTSSSSNSVSSPAPSLASSSPEKTTLSPSPSYVAPVQPGPSLQEVLTLQTIIGFRLTAKLEFKVVSFNSTKSAWRNDRALASRLQKVILMTFVQFPTLHPVTVLAEKAGVSIYSLPIPRQLFTDYTAPSPILLTDVLSPLPVPALEASVLHYLEASLLTNPNCLVPLFVHTSWQPLIDQLSSNNSHHMAPQRVELLHAPAYFSFLSGLLPPGFMIQSAFFVSIPPASEEASIPIPFSSGSHSLLLPCYDFPKVLVLSAEEEHFQMQTSPNAVYLMANSCNPIPNIMHSHESVVNFILLDLQKAPQPSDNPPTELHSILDHHQPLFYSLSTQTPPSPLQSSVSTLESDTPVSKFLTSISLPQYTTLFHDQGFELLEDLFELDDSGLKAVGIELLGHRTRILRHARTHQSKTEINQ